MMRTLLEQRRGRRIYVFTTFGAVHAAVVETVEDDVVHMRGPDGKILIVALADVSSLREYDQDPTR